MTKDTLEEFLQLRAGIEPLNSRMRKNNLVLREKYMRLQPEDTRQELAEKSVKKRIKTRVGWREESKEQIKLVINRKGNCGSDDPVEHQHHTSQTGEEERVLYGTGAKATDGVRDS